MKKIRIVLIASILMVGGYMLIQGVDKLIIAFDKQKLGLLLICEDEDFHNNIIKAKDKIHHYYASDIKIDKDILFIRKGDFQQLYEEKILWNVVSEEFIKEEQLIIDAVSNSPTLWCHKKDKQKTSAIYQGHYSIGTGTPLTNKIMIVSNEEYAILCAKEYKLLFLNYRENPKLDMELYDYDKIQLTMIDN